MSIAKQEEGAAKSRWILGFQNPADSTPFLKGLGLGKKRIQAVEDSSGIKQVVDTDDWDYWEKGWLGTADGADLHFQNIVAGNDYLLPIAAKLPMSGGTLPVQIAGQPFRKIAGIRALMNHGGWSERKTRYEYLNRDGKTVFRFWVCEYEFEDDLGEEGLHAVEIFIEPLRGYQKTTIKILRAAGFEPFKIYSDQRNAIRVREMLQARKTCELTIEPDMSCGKLFGGLLRQGVFYLEHNAEGILADIDVEFLHAFRVRMRRLKSWITLCRRLFPQEDFVQLKADFRWLSDLSGPARDMDVYLLSYDDFERRLPAALMEGLKPFFELLKKQRKTAYGRLAKGLKSSAYGQMLKRWEAIADRWESLEEGVLQSTEASRFIHKRVVKKFAAVQRSAQCIPMDCDDETLHTLRLDFKKIRYLLELHRKLESDPTLEKEIKKFRRLQNALGQFNDTSVQLEDLQQKLEDESKRKAPQVHFVAAVGAMIDQMTREHAAQKVKCLERLEALREDKGVLEKKKL